MHSSQNFDIEYKNFLCLYIKSENELITFPEYTKLIKIINKIVNVFFSKIFKLIAVVVVLVNVIHIYYYYFNAIIPSKI